MTVLNAMVDLLTHFSNKDSFSFEDDYKDVVKILGLDKDEEPRLAAFHAALDIITEQGTVKKSLVKKKNIWVLTESFKNKSLQVSLSYESCIFLAKVINDFCTANGVDRSCNPNQVVEEDINFLGLLVKNYNSVTQDKNGEE
jgi:hypothetical protein